MILKFSQLLVVSTSAQLLNFIFLPYIALLFGPENYGKFASFYSIMQILIVWSSFSLPLAVVQANDATEAGQIGSSCFIVSFLFSFLLLLALIFINKFIRIESHYYWMCLATFLWPLYQLSYQNLSKRNHINALSLLIFINVLLANTYRYFSGIFFEPHYSVISVFSVIGLMTSAMVGFFITYLALDLRIFKLRIDLRQFKKIYVKYKAFIFNRTPQTGLNLLNKNLLIIILPTTMTAIEFGNFALAFAISASASMLMSNSISALFYPKITALIQKGDKHHAIEITKKLSILLLVFATLLNISIVIISNHYFFTQMKNDWSSIIYYIALILPGLTMSVVAKPSIDAIPILQLEAIFLKAEIIYLCLRVITIAVLLFKVNPAVIIITYSGLNVIFYTYIIMYVVYRMWRLP